MHTHQAGEVGVCKELCKMLDGQAHTKRSRQVKSQGERCQRAKKHRNVLTRAKTDRKDDTCSICEHTSLLGLDGNTLGTH